MSTLQLAVYIWFIFFKSCEMAWYCWIDSL